MPTEWNVLAGPLKSIAIQYWRGSRWMLALLAVITLLSSVLSVIAPYIFSRLLDRLGSADRLETAIWGFSLYAFLMGAAFALENAGRYLAAMSSEDVNFTSTTLFFQRLLKKRIDFFIDHNPAEIQTAQTTGSSALVIFIQLLLMVFLPATIQTVSALIVMGAVISLEAVITVLIYGAVFILVTYKANLWTRPFLDKAVEASQDNAKFLGNAINAIETLRHFGSDEWIESRFTGTARTIRKNWYAFSRRKIAVSAFYGVALFTQLVVTFAILLPRFRQGELSVGDIVLFNALLLRLNLPFHMVGQTLDDLVQSYARFGPFARMWAAPEEAAPDVEKPLVVSKGEIVFDGVSFAFEGGRGVKNVSFRAGRERINFLTGKTGSGKSTLFKLALKSIEPQRGRIFVDELALPDIGRSQWFALVGVVPQDAIMLNDTLSSNIVLGRAADKALLRSAAAKAAILDFIEGLPDGFDTVVGERGLKLSGGERQRIAIARALYAGPGFLFLDEASSALDEATEKAIFDHLRTIASKVTIVAITHRKSVIEAEDQVVRLDDGNMSTDS